MFKNFWERSAKRGKMGARTTPAKSDFFLSSKRDDISATSKFGLDT